MNQFNVSLVKILCHLVVITTTTMASLGSQSAFASWKEQGPGPILNGGNVELPNGPQVGAINGIVTHPTDSDIVYVGAVNGGIWKTENATAPNPKWKPLTDSQLPASSISSLAMSPLNSKVLFAGTGSTSSDDQIGSPGFGVARSTDGGKTWKVLASETFTGRVILSIVPTSLKKGKVVLAGTLEGDGGVFRSTDGGSSFERISGKPGSNLPDQGVSSVVADPGNSKRFYAAVPIPKSIKITQSAADPTGSEGVYRSDDGGKHWTLVTQGLTDFSNSPRMLLAVHDNPVLGINVLYVMIISPSGQLAGVFRSENQGDLWTSMAPLPTPEIFPGHQGRIHGAIVADPFNPNVVFIAGDRQEGPFPNVNGCDSFSANVFRGDASLLPANPWENVVCNGAHGTSPHPDARAMVFDPSGNILHSNDGGIYRLIQPNNPNLRIWTSALGNIRPCEIHSAAYDSVSNIVFGGAQDNGTPVQLASGKFPATDISGGDGGVVAVDSDQIAHPGTSIRYSCAQFLMNFSRRTYNAANELVDGPTPLPLLIVSGPGTGETLFEFDLNIQFDNPYVLNAIDQSRMLIGTASIYESFDRGDTLHNLGFQSQFISCLAYGGRLNGNDQPDIFYVGTRPTSHLPSRILKRVNIGDPITVLDTYPGAAVLSIAMDPENFQNIFVVDSLAEVWNSPDGGITWRNLTGNLQKLAQNIVNVLVAFPLDGRTRLAAGALGGVFILDDWLLGDSSSEDPEWKRLSKKLPHSDVLDLHFDLTDNLLVAGVFGRGIWTLPLASLSSDKESKSSKDKKKHSHSPRRIDGLRMKEARTMENEVDLPSWDIRTLQRSRVMNPKSPLK